MAGANNRAGIGSSNASLNALTHQYHYIQYPTFWQQQQQQQQQASASGRQRWLQDQQQQQQQQQQSSSAPIEQCHCACSCAQTEQIQQQQQWQQQQQNDGQVAVDVLVHQQQQQQQQKTTEPQSTAIKAQSTQSLLNHSYQALQLDDGDINERKQLSTFGRSTSCDCDLECTCTAGAMSNAARLRSHNAFTEAMLAADEITVSESDNNSSTMVKKKKVRDNKQHKMRESLNRLDSVDAAHQAKYNQVYSNQRRYSSSSVAEWTCFKGNERDPIEDNRPPLPPRPPPARPQHSEETASLNDQRAVTGMKKYAFCCLFCGSVSCVLGILFLFVYFMLHSYTITVGNFETVPAFVPAALLILTGICMISLARRRNRCNYLIKLTGVAGLISALVCALVTVTTTVLHMSRLQALRECEYAQKTRTCTCYSDLISTQIDRVDKGVRLVFDSLSDCNVVHGTLYSCLRAIFGLSVGGVLIAVFSCMLVYLLLSHEKKKMYWEQLELRCRSLYASQIPQSNMATLTAPGRVLNCRCCEQCHAHRQLQLPMHSTGYPWDEGNSGGINLVPEQQRFWPTQPPGNFYSPNPGGEEHSANINCHAITERSRSSGWSWPRMPWQRNTPGNRSVSNHDSQYGFTTENNLIEESMPMPAHNGQPYNVLPYNIWGPPPPYSDPNSPARRGYYQYLQPNACMPPSSISIMERPLNTRNSPASNGQRNAVRGSSAALSAASGSNRSHNKRQAIGNKAAVYENTPSDSETGSQKARSSNTLPTRKLKKRPDLGGPKSIGPNNNTAHRPNVQQVFSIEQTKKSNVAMTNNEETCKTSTNQENRTHAEGIENNGYKGSVESNNINTVNGSNEAGDAFESDVYFADVSSCCGVSVKNDNYYEDCKAQKDKHEGSLNCSEASNQSSTDSNKNSKDGIRPDNNNDMEKNSKSFADEPDQNEDYLTQRFGQRENSTRSRLPFPQSAASNDEDTTTAIFENDQDDSVPQIEQQQTPQKLLKDISCQSMCSMVSEAKTELTDLSPITTPTNNTDYCGTPSILSRQVRDGGTEGHYEIINDFNCEHQQQQSPSNQNRTNLFARLNEFSQQSGPREVPKTFKNNHNQQAQMAAVSYRERRVKRL